MWTLCIINTGNFAASQLKANAMTYAFEQNVPVPTAPGAPRYPFRHLKVGDSVLYPCAADDAKARARKAAYRIAEHHEWQVVVRKLPEGVRVWRIA